LAVFEPTWWPVPLSEKLRFHNMDQIERLDVRVGDTVVIQKGRGRDSEVVEVVPKMAHGQRKKNSKCPLCARCAEAMLNND